MRFLALAALLSCSAMAAPALPHLPTHALGPATPPRIDGRLDDAVWQTAPTFEAFQRFRPDSAPDAGPYRTAVQILVTPDALIFALRAWDPEPAQIRAPLARRDQIYPDQDAITLWIDPNGRQQVAQFVRVNASGSLADGLYSAAADEEDAAPDYLDVEAAAQRLPDGYSIEIRWPLASLRYPLDGQLPWRLMVSRRVPRDTMLTFTSVPLTRDHPHLLALLQTLDRPEALQQGLAQAQHRVLRSELTVRHGEPQRASPRANLGLEAQWRPRADWVLDATVRPDFSQVDLDDPQLAGNTRFALFVPEKRAFFLESSDVLGQVMPDNWGVARGLLAFYSRTVTNPRWGLRATWRGTEAEATALALQDAGGGLRLRPGPFGTESVDEDRRSRLLFARHRSQLHEDWALAGLVSLREWEDGARSSVLGLDFQGEPGEAEQWRGHLLFSREQEAGRARDGHAGWLSWRHRGEGWRWQADWERLSPRFTNDNGFVPQAGIERRSVEFLLPHHLDDGGPILSWEAMLRLQDVQALRDPEQQVQRRQAIGQAVQPGFWLLGPLSTEVFGHVNLQRQRAQAQGRLHRPNSLLLGLDSHPGPRWTYVHLELEWGERLDVEADRVGRGHMLSSQLTLRERLPAWLGGWEFEAEQRWGFGTVRAPNGGRALREAQAQTKLLLYFSPEQALRLLHQRGRTVRTAEPGLAGGREAHEVSTLTWLARAGALRGWSVGANWSRKAQSAPRQRELFVKFQQGWDL
ncbi:hypothetical protein [Inhella sp.]|uniref:hypothetical protein n=1 Tax=Inhella sp. TaxID=1921806 RepID=UPI0035AE92AF